jgi:hypothetical protein
MLTSCFALAFFMHAGFARAVERDDFLAVAPAYETHEWVCSVQNTTGVDCPSGYSSDFTPGTYYGLPYDWGGWVTLDEYDSDLADGQGAGSHSSDGVLSCTTGLDCSGYVSILWKLPYKIGTSTIHGVSDAIDARDMFPGDVYNKAGSHVIMWTGKDTNGDALITESSGTCNGVCGRAVSFSYFGSYVPRSPFATHVQTATVGNAVGTVADPVVINSLPFRDWRNTREATSDIFDSYSTALNVDESGPEIIYTVDLPSPGEVRASLIDAPGSDVDLHLLSSADSNDCLARAHIDLVHTVSQGGKYYIVADTFVGSGGTEYPGAYVLDVSFSASDADSDTDADSDSDGDADSDADSDADGDADGDSDSDGDADSDTDSDADGDGDSDADGDSDGDTDTDEIEDGGPSADTSSNNSSDDDCGCLAVGQTHPGGMPAVIITLFADYFL